MLIYIARFIAARMIASRKAKKGRRGSQMIEEGLLLGLSLVAMMILLTLLSDLIATLKLAYQGSEGALDKFIVEVLGEDLDAIYNATIGKISGG
ncbi:MAG: hypothetical protein DRJ44_02930 [Thermoprotei archaeon]|nr:MAG: hypothetical protein DRJ44_02930 [Thermoprotei archaeon]